MKRTQSVQNIGLPGSASVSRAISVKRAYSSQNVSGKGSSRQVRLSVPVNAMAYNAELLANFEKEKKAMERRISELIQIAENRKTDVEMLKYEVKNLKGQIIPENVYEELELLRRENQMLKEQLCHLNVSVEHFTDSEKLSLLQKKNNATREAFEGFEETACRVHSCSDVDSRENDCDIGLIVGDMMNLEPRSSYSLDGNWDKQSNKSSEGGLSEVSVANLQDRILQMEETHYSTSEELQATLQELTDLQDAVNDLSAENERLADEKYVLLESLCTQTEKLENARLHLDFVKALVLGDSDSRPGERSENERQLVALVKSAQEEREEMLLKQAELTNTLQLMEKENQEMQAVIVVLKNEGVVHKMKVEGLLTEKRALDSQTCTLKEQISKDQLELQHYKVLYENEKQKVAELEQERKITNKSDLEALVDSTRQEKDKVEDRLTNIEEELSVKTMEVNRLKEMCSGLQEEISADRNSFSFQCDELELKLKNSESEKADMQAEIEALRDHIEVLQNDCDQYLEEKKTFTLTVARGESEIRIARSKIARLENELKERSHQFTSEQEDWKQFQHDLQRAVVIANEFKTEAQEEMDRIIADNQLMQDKIAVLQKELEVAHSEIERLKPAKQSIDPHAIMSREEIRGKVLSTVDRELAVRRQGRLSADSKGLAPSLSVRHLITSIEDQVKNERDTIPPPSSPLVGTPRRDSQDGSSKLAAGSNKLLVARQNSSPVSETNLKKLLRRSAGEPKENRPSPNHRHTISEMMLQGPTVTDDAKQAVAESVAPPVANKDNQVDSTRKPLTGILTNKSSSTRRKTSSNVR